MFRDDCRILNTGSPYNVVAGWGSGNIDAVIEKYQREHRELEEKKLKMLAKKQVEDQRQRAARNLEAKDSARREPDEKKRRER